MDAERVHRLPVRRELLVQKNLHVLKAEFGEGTLIWDMCTAEGTVSDCRTGLGVPCVGNVCSLPELVDATLSLPLDLSRDPAMFLPVLIVATAFLVYDQ